MSWSSYRENCFIRNNFLVSQYLQYDIIAFDVNFVSSLRVDAFNFLIGFLSVSFISFFFSSLSSLLYWSGSCNGTIFCPQFPDPNLTIAHQWHAMATDHDYGFHFFLVDFVHHPIRKIKRIYEQHSQSYRKRTSNQILHIILYIFDVRWKLTVCPYRFTSFMWSFSYFIMPLVAKKTLHFAIRIIHTKRGIYVYIPKISGCM